jgi:hypothetical protein
MPSVSKKQHNLMAMVANDPAAAKRMNIKQAVGAEFMKADKGRKFVKGGMAHDDIREDKKLIKKAFGMHDKQEHKGQHTDLSKLKKGGTAMASKRVAKEVTKEMEYDYKSGKKSFRGSTAKKDAHAEKEGKIVAKHLAYDKDKDAMCGGGKVKKMAAGGYVRAADGVAQRGKTKGRLV